LGNGTTTNGNLPAVCGITLNAPECLAWPTGFSAVSKTDTTIDLVWNDVSEASEYEIDYDGSSVTAYDTGITLSSLVPSTRYTIKIRSIIDDAAGAWSLPVYVNTYPSGVDNFPDGRTILAGGLSHTTVISEGTVFTWGQGSDGRLGTGSNTDASSPQEIGGLSDVVSVVSGSAYTLALTADGKVYSWGNNIGGGGG
jgi:hypothetical protein